MLRILVVIPGWFHPLQHHLARQIGTTVPTSYTLCFNTPQIRERRLLIDLASPELIIGNWNE